MISVTAFVDWNSQLWHVQKRDETHTAALSTAAFSRVCARIARALCKMDSKERFRIVIRLYGGWHKGFEPSEQYRALRQSLAFIDFAAISRQPRVVISESVYFGHELLMADKKRFHAQFAAHLTNTYRDEGEKMVDTALAADIVAWAFTTSNEWSIIMSEDDDMVPPLFTAEMAQRNRGGRVSLMRARPNKGPFLKLDGLLMEIGR